MEGGGGLGVYIAGTHCRDPKDTVRQKRMYQQMAGGVRTAAAYLSKQANRFATPAQTSCDFRFFELRTGVLLFFPTGCITSGRSAPGKRCRRCSRSYRGDFLMATQRPRYSAKVRGGSGEARLGAWTTDMPLAAKDEGGKSLAERRFPKPTLALCCSSRYRFFSSSCNWPRLKYVFPWATFFASAFCRAISFCNKSIAPAQVPRTLRRAFVYPRCKPHSPNAV